MGIFADIPPLGNDLSTVRAARAIVAEAEERQLRPGPWSLAELQLDVVDYVWLRGWGRGMTASTARQCLDSWRRVDVLGESHELRAATGLVYFALIAETARREAREGHLWSHVVWSIYGDDGAPATVFLQGQPSHFLKEAMEAAATSFELRHMFGQRGVQNWFDSVYLQFGFTSEGFRRRLPEWLVGQPATVAITALRDAGPLHSDSFAKLWSAVREYRRNNISRDRCQAVAADSPWILADWVPDLLKHAKDRIELPEWGGPPGEAEDDAAPVFLGPPRLSWAPPADLRFVTDVSGLADFDLSSPSYSVAIEDRVVARLIRQEDGTYTLPLGDDSLDVAPRRPVVQARLLDMEGSLESAMELSLWDPDEDLTLFRVAISDGELRGKRIGDAYATPVKPNHAYVIIAAGDLEPAFEPAYRASIAGGAWMAYYIAGGWEPSTLRFLLDGEVFWRPCQMREPRAREPEWARRVTVLPPSHPVRLGESLALNLVLPEDVDVRYVRAGVSPVDWTRPIPRRCELQELAVGVDHASSAISLKIGLERDGEHCVVRRVIDVPSEGAAYLGKDGWTALPPSSVLDAREARGVPFRILAPFFSRDEGEEWGLLEGSTFLRLLRERPRPIGAVAGLGAPLRLQRGPYNCFEEPMHIAAAVTDRGIVKNVVKGARDNEFAVLLNAAVEPDEHHRVLWWDESGRIVEGSATLAHEDADGLSAVWRVYTAHELGEPIAVGVSYEGVRVGAWWPPEWHGSLSASFEADAVSSAAMLRWMRLPLLEDRAARACAAVIGLHPAEVVGTWLSESEPGWGLVLPAFDTAWSGALRALLSGAGLSGKSRAAIVSVFVDAAATPETGLENAVRALTRVDPALMAWSVQDWLTRVGEVSLGREWAEHMTLRLECALLGVDPAACNGTTRVEVWKKLIDRAAYEMRVDTNFVKIGLLERALRAWRKGGYDHGLDKMNVDLALSVEPFRHLLASLLIHDIVPKS